MHIALLLTAVPNDSDQSEQPTCISALDSRPWHVWLPQVPAKQNEAMRRAQTYATPIPRQDNNLNEPLIERQHSEPGR